MANQPPSNFQAPEFLFPSLRVTDDLPFRPPMANQTPPNFQAPEFLFPSLRVTDDLPFRPPMANQTPPNFQAPEFLFPSQQVSDDLPFRPAMANQTPPNFQPPEFPSSCSGVNSMNEPGGSSLLINPPSQQQQQLNGPVAILWDIENCSIPSDVRAEDVAGNIRMAVRLHPVVTGVVTLFSAFGDFNAVPRRLREGCQSTGVKLVDVPNSKKDAADKAILVDLFLFALDNPPPSTIVLISGDVDFAPALHILGQRGYAVIIVIPARTVATALTSAGRFVWDWPSVAHGEGFVRSRPLANNNLGYCGAAAAATHNEEEVVVYAGRRDNRRTSSDLFISSHVTTAIEKHRTTVGNRNTPAPCLGPRRGGGGANAAAVADRLKVQQGGGGEEEELWVKPGDMKGLKEQFLILLYSSGGSMPLVRISQEYQKRYGRPLFMAEYGSLKLVNLIWKMGSPLTVVGSGRRKLVCLRNPPERRENGSKSPDALEKEESSSIPSYTLLRRDPRKGKETAIKELKHFFSIPHDDDEEKDNNDNDDDEEEDERSRHVESFRKEMQEMLVCFSCRILMSSFDALYEQRYKKRLDYILYGVGGLEELAKKVSDVVELRVEDGRYFLVSRFIHHGCLR